MGSRDRSTTNNSEANGREPAAAVIASVLPSASFAAPLDRRRFLSRSLQLGVGLGAGAVLGACGSSSAPFAQSAAPGSVLGTVPPVTQRPAGPAAALEELKAGNERFATGNARHSNQGAELRQALALTQAPWAGIIACADSRVVPELIFDQGIGDLFDARAAGNVADRATVASVAYAVGVLNVEVIVVMAHSNCGAVKTTIDVVKGKTQAGEFAVLTDAIRPAVDTVHPTSSSGEPLDRTSEENARLQAAALPSRSPILADAAKANKLTVVAAMYDLGSGRVRFLT